MAGYMNPLVLQRADPWVIRWKGSYYFTASYPAYDRIVLRQAVRLNDLQAAPEKTIWRKHASGPMSRYIWAPELHHVGDAWYIYFAAAEKDFSPDQLPTHRIYVLENMGDDPMGGEWVEKGQIRTRWDTFSLDATTEVIDGVQYLVWAQKDPSIDGNSNLYIARMKNPWTLDSTPVMLSRPEYSWECVDFKVNEGPAFLLHGDRVYLTYSASGTGVPYAVGLLSARRGSDLLDPASWTKSPRPVFSTNAVAHQYGPGHNCFTVSEDGRNDLMIYHARDYTDIVGDPLVDPNRHACVTQVRWTPDGPDFGVARPATRWTPRSTDILPPDGIPAGGIPDDNRPRACEMKAHREED